MTANMFHCRSHSVVIISSFIIYHQSNTTYVNVERELLTLPKHLRSPRINGILDAQYLVFCVLLRRQLLFVFCCCRFSFAHCIVYSCLIYDIFWLPVLYLQTFVVATHWVTCMIIREHSGKLKKYHIRRYNCSLLDLCVVKSFGAYDIAASVV